MNEEQVSDYLEKLCIDNNLQLLTKNIKNKKNKTTYIFDTHTNINEFAFIKSNKIGMIKEAKDKRRQRKIELIKKQLKNVPEDKAFRKSDINRIVKHTDTSIFDAEKCCLWSGYVTNMNDAKKGTYINFYFKNKKKVALHRLLYINFKGNLNNTDYIKYSCDNKGVCCNINHMIKFEYKIDDIHEKNKTKKNPKKQTKQSKKIRETKKFINDNDFKISFF